MLSLMYLFWMLVIIFAIVGSMRGWGGEIVVAFCAIFGLAINALLRRYFAFVAGLSPTDVSLLWFRVIVLTVSVYFGYEIINNPYLASKTADSAAARDRLASTLFGSVLGAFNGYLLAGSLIFYVAAADYPFPSIIARPSNPDLVQAINQMLNYMPPSILGEPRVYFAMILAFLLLLVIFSAKEGSRA